MKCAIPVPTQETRPFWDGVAAGRIVLPRCEACAAVRYPPPSHCPLCLSDHLTWVELSPKGVLMSWSRVHLDGPAGLKAPFTVAAVAIEGADGVMVALLTDQSKPPRAGEPVSIAFEPVDSSTSWVPVVQLCGDPL